MVKQSIIYQNNIQQKETSTGKIDPVAIIKGEGKRRPTQCFLQEVLWTEVPGGLLAVHEVSHRWTRLKALACIHALEKETASVCLPGESPGGV